MERDLKYSPPLKTGRRQLLLCLIAIGVLTEIGFLPFFKLESQETHLALVSENLNKLATVQGNSLLPIADFSISSPQFQTRQKIKVVITAYSSTPWETDDNPFLTAAGTWVRDGIVANNLLPIGTKIKIPELFGNKIFVVEDRMSWKKGNYHVDIWFPDYWQALNFGMKRTYIEILKN